MKNYIANGKGDWATSAAFVKYSFERSIHHGRLYTNGHGFFKGKDEDLAEALRCLGQGLHTLEDFGAHTNYVELALREMGFHNVFPHVGTATAITLHGKHVYPLVTGTFGMVDFYHSVLGEASDHFTQSEVNEMDDALGTAQAAAQSSNPLSILVKLLSKVPGTKDLCEEAERLQVSSQAQARANELGNNWGGPSNWGGQGGWRGIDQSSGSSRGVGDWGSSRASQPEWSAPQSAYPPPPQGYDTNAWNVPQQGYQQPPPDGNQHPPQHQWNQQSPPQWDQHQPQWNQHQPQPQWNQHQPQYHQEPPQSFATHNQYPGPTPPPAPQQYTMPPGAPAASLQQPTSPPTGTVSGNGSGSGSDVPNLDNFDPAKLVSQIYPILVFRDKVVRSISAIIEKIPGLEALVDRITETLTVFILSLLAPFVRPVIKTISKSLQTGSEGVINSSGKHQYEVWTDPQSSDPTHSMLSKDHFSNILNEPAGNVAAEILKFIAPRVLYAWEHPDVPVQQVIADIEHIFHHPAIRNERIEVHRVMFQAVRRWVDGLSDRSNIMENVLSSEGVRSGKNHKDGVNPHLHGSAQHHSPAGYGGGQHSQQAGGHGSSPFGMVSGMIGNFTGQGPGQGQGHGYGSHQQQQQHHNQSAGSGFGDILNIANKLPIPGVQKFTGEINKFSKYTSFIPGGFGGGGGRRALDEVEDEFGEIGGRSDLREAAQHQPYLQEPDRTASVSPLPPSGYEMYGGSGAGDAGHAHGSGDQYPQYGLPSGPPGLGPEYGTGGAGASESYYRG